jgi:2-polyprenyl-6-methoxyphenol hydroxylase-like FAD-dependent oxidoreductase
MTALRILIVGAGIGGLTAALALLRDGHEVAVYEQARRLAELGAGVQISANGARVLFALGLEDAIRASGASRPARKSGCGTRARPGSCSTSAPSRSRATARRIS